MARRWSLWILPVHHPRAARLQPIARTPCRRCSSCQLPVANSGRADRHGRYLPQRFEPICARRTGRDCHIEHAAEHPQFRARAAGRPECRHERPVAWGFVALSIRASAWAWRIAGAAAPPPAPYRRQSRTDAGPVWRQSSRADLGVCTRPASASQSPIRTPRTFAMGTASLGERPPIALQKVDRRAAGAVRRRRTAEFGRKRNRDVG